MPTWLLAAYIGLNGAFVIQDLASEEECHRLAHTLNLTPAVPVFGGYRGYRCYPYVKAK